MGVDRSTRLWRSTAFSFDSNSTRAIKLKQSQAMLSILGFGIEETDHGKDDWARKP